MARFARLTGTRAHCELDRQWSTTPPSRAHALPGSPQRHPDTGSKTRRRLLRARLALPTPVGPVRRRSGSRNRRRSPRVGRRALRGELDSCSFGSLRENSRGRRPGLSRGQQHRRPSHTSSWAGSCVSLTHVLWNSKVPRLRNVVRAKLTGSTHEIALCIAHAPQTTSPIAPRCPTPTTTPKTFVRHRFAHETHR